MNASLVSAAITERSHDPRWTLVERIASSRHFKSSARLCQLLFYVADCAIREAPADATEQQIGVHVFHRSPGYNSSEDSIVRTHARLLRQKLAAYFAEEGVSEKIVLEVPKGHYLPIFGPRSAPDSPPPLIRIEPPLSSSPEKAGVHSVLARWGKGALLLFLLLIIAAAVWLGRPHLKPAASTAPPSAIERFWSPFFGPDPPLVVYSNALFVGDSTHGLRYARGQPPQDAQQSDNYVDTYTGIGELNSVYNLTRLFDSYRSHFTLKRSLLMTWDEAKLKDLIFIGSVAENPSLRVLQSTTDFSMIAAPGSAGIVNHHPKPGEPAVYSRPERPLTKDYAILALLPGVQPGKRMLIFSGLTTFGTQAAVDFVSRPDSTAEILRQITATQRRNSPL